MISARLTDDQKQMLAEATSLYQKLRDARQQSESFKGGMHWKKSKGREYLFRSHDRFGYGKSLGPRSAATEQKLAAFRQAKAEWNDNISALKKRLKSNALLCKKASLGRVPLVLTRILSHLDQHPLLRDAGVVVNGFALYAYEAAAKAILEDELIVQQKSPTLAFYFEKPIQQDGFIHLLQKADRSFKRVRSRSFLAMNRTGLHIKLLSANSKTLKPPDDPAEFIAEDLPDLSELVRYPRISQIVIDTQGNAAPMTVPDPRGFALHKLWLSQQSDREAEKRARDFNQSRAIVRLIVQNLTEYRFTISELRLLPPDLLKECKGWAAEIL